MLILGRGGRSSASERVSLSESKPRPPDAFCIFHFTPADELSPRQSELVQAKEANCNLLELCIFGFKSAALFVRLRVIQFLMKYFTERPVLRGKIKMLSISGLGAIYDPLYCQSRPTNNTFTWTGVRGRARETDPAKNFAIKLRCTLFCSGWQTRFDLPPHRSRNPICCNLYLPSSVKAARAGVPGECLIAIVAAFLAHTTNFGCLSFHSS
jgi:hypothetical protein